MQHQRLLNSEVRHLNRQQTQTKNKAEVYGGAHTEMSKV